MHILMAKINKDYKLAMIKFIQHFDKEVFEIPSGPEGLVSAVYCLKVNYVLLFNTVVWPKDFSACKLNFNDRSVRITFFLQSDPRTARTL